MEPQTTSHKKTRQVIGGVVVFAVALVSIFAGKKSPASTPVAATPVDTTAKPTVTKPSTVASSSVTSNTEARLYIDGTYSATGSYFSPGGPDTVGVTLTLAGDIVTDVSVTPGAGDRTSARYQEQFISGYKAYVVGKNIDSIHLTRVSGSSLTPEGFNDALKQIEAKARA